MAALPPPDVPMDMSSPTHRMDEDHDIEVEIEDYPLIDYNDDDNMMEDGEQHRPDTADENMDDDVHVALIHEDVMQDEPLLDVDTLHADEDDELIDYDDDEPVHEASEPIGEDVGTTNFGEASFASTENHNRTPVEAEQEETTDSANPDNNKADDDGRYASDLSAAGNPGQESVTDTLQQLEKTNHSVQTGTSSLDDSNPASLADALAVSTEHEEANLKENDSHGSENQDEQRHDTNESYEADTANFDRLADEQVSTFNTTTQTSQEPPASPTDTGLHPVTITYKDIEFPLFKSRTAPDGLLHDDNLASLSLSDLMRSCREELAFDLGLHLEHGQDLSFTFDHMECTILETEHSAFEFSLKEILDNYVQLNRNDHVQDIPAMHISISSKCSFAKLFPLMQSSVSEGLGLSSFSYLKDDDDDQYEPVNSDLNGAQEEEDTDKDKEPDDPNAGEIEHGQKYYGEEDYQEDEIHEASDMHREQDDTVEQDGEEVQSGFDQEARTGSEEPQDVAQVPQEAAQVSSPKDSNGAELVSIENEEQPSETSSTTLRDEQGPSIDIQTAESVSQEADQADAVHVSLAGNTTDNTLGQTHQDATALQSEAADDRGDLSVEDQELHHQDAGSDDESSHLLVENDEGHRLDFTVDEDVSREIAGNDDELDESVFHTTYEYEDHDDENPENQTLSKDTEGNADNRVTADDEDPEEHENLDQDESDLIDYDEAAEEIGPGHADQEKLNTTQSDRSPHLKQDAAEGHQAVDDPETPGGDTNNDDTNFTDQYDDLLHVPDGSLTSKSPRAKRRLDESADDYIDFSEDDEPEPKKARAAITSLA